MVFIVLRFGVVENAGTRRTEFTYAKLGPFAILGFIAMPASTPWAGTRVFGGHGRIPPRNYSMPDTFMDYIFEKAGRLATMYDQMSDKQADYIDEAL